MNEDAEKWIDHILQGIGISRQAATDIDQYILLALIVGIVLTADIICRKLLLKLVDRLVKQTKATWDDIVFDRKVMNDLGRIVAPVLLLVLIPVFFQKESPAFFSVLLKFCNIYIVVAIIRFVNSFLKAIYTVFSEKERYRHRPLKGWLQTMQVILFFIGGIIVVSILIGKSPVVLFTGLGASAAILMLVFKDSILGFVSGIQLSANNMLKVGDWITVPKYDADGTVIEVTLNTVKVRNWDNTITMLPPYVLTTDSFQNWRGMQESGGRRVKRSIYIDMTSIRFCTDAMLAKYRKVHYLSDYIQHTQEVIRVYNEVHHIDNSVLINGRRQTNLGVFRAYLDNYLKNLPDVNPDLTCMVRHLQPTITGIPIELYFFSANKAWVDYERIQADVFDHVLAVIPEFDLRVFQNPTGEDLRSWAQARE